MSDNRLHLSIDDWLRKLDLLIYKPLLKDYDGVEEILWMSERELKNIGIHNSSHRARLGSSLAILKEKYSKISRETHSSSHRDGNSFSGYCKTMTPTRTSPAQRAHFSKFDTGVRSWPSSKPSTIQNTTHTSPTSNFDGYPVTETTASDLKRALEKELSLDSSDLKSHAWYHGTILRQRAEELVTQEGDFLVRDCISQPGDFVITCKWNNLPLHFIIKKVILQPDTVYEKFQYCFEKESFDTIPDFITYYVGSKCPLSESSGVIIKHPVNRTMPLSYYASRYGVQCQIHYVAKALEKIPYKPSVDNKPSCNDLSPVHIEQKNLFPVFEMRGGSKNVDNVNFNKTNTSCNQGGTLIRVGSDPLMNTNPEIRTVEQRPNSGVFNSECLVPVPKDFENKPPPKPSRVPSKRCAQKPVIIKKERKLSSKDSEFDSINFISIPNRSLTHISFQRQTSETRFSFLDRASVSSCGSTPDMDSDKKQFTLPDIKASSSFEPQKFSSSLLMTENPPLEASVLSHMRNLILSCSSKNLAYHLTKIDLEIACNYKEVDLGLGVTSGLELFLLPQGEQMRKDLIERTESMKLLVAVLLLTTPEEDDRVKLLNKWIEIAIETKTALGNFYGFTSIMLGLTLPEILGLHSTWLALRHSFTDVAFVFETKLRPTFKSLQNVSGLEAPNTCFPYILSLLLTFEQYMSVISSLNNQSFPDEMCNNILGFNLPGSYSSDDYGLQLLADHLETGRNILQRHPMFRTNGQMSLQGIKYNNVLLDIFKTEFHLRLLWGYRGSVVRHDDRHKIFKKVVSSLYQKCLAVSN